MNIVCLNGSPRKKGNSTQISKAFCDAAEQKGAAVTTWHLNKLDFRGCQACYGCKKKSEICVLKDDLTEILAAVREADVLVLASPVYFGEVSSQLKAFIDRTFSFLVPDFHEAPKPHRLEGDKTLVFALTQGNADENLFKDIYPKYSGFYKWMGFETTELIRACGVSDPKDITERNDILDQAKALGEKLAG